MHVIAFAAHIRLLSSSQHTELRQHVNCLIARFTSSLQEASAAEGLFHGQDIIGKGRQHIIALIKKTCSIPSKQHSF